MQRAESRSRASNISASATSLVLRQSSYIAIQHIYINNLEKGPYIFPGFICIVDGLEALTACHNHSKIFAWEGYKLQITIEKKPRGHRYQMSSEFYISKKRDWLLSIHCHTFSPEVNMLAIDVMILAGRLTRGKRKAVEEVRLTRLQAKQRGVGVEDLMLLESDSLRPVAKKPRRRSRIPSTAARQPEEENNEEEASYDEEEEEEEDEEEEVSD